MSTKRNRKRSRGRGGSSQKSNFQAVKKPKLPCAICSDIINDIMSAIAQPLDGAPVHFDCALNVVSTQLNPSEGQTIIYLGNGSFAAVDLTEYRRRRLKIERRVDDWEHLEERSEWRKNLQVKAR